MGRLFASRQQVVASPAKTASFSRRAAPVPAQGRDLTRIPLSQTVREDEEAAPAPVSRTDAGVKGGSGSPPPPPALTVATRTLVKAPDGTADTRTTVGVNEEVALTGSAGATWTASTGTVVTAGGAATWTAPGAAGAATLTATPASGSAVNVAMTVLPPSSRALTVDTNRVYDPDRSGSGFHAKVVIQPTKVSFMRTEFREETVNAVASGYYDTVLRWNGMAHPVTSWISPDAANSGLLDKIGTNAPGGPKPFSSGRFLWAIPQSFRTPGVGAGSVYSTARHEQTMFAFPMGLAAGTEVTSKEGAIRARTPTA